MTKRIKHITAQAQDSYLGDIVGGAALMIILVAGLHLPGLF
ncbi:MAG: hypothetical protein AAFN44_19165 [Pseudomonadota bacterium]